MENECTFNTWYLDYIDDGCDAVRNAAHAAWQHQAERIAAMETKTALMAELVDFAKKEFRRIPELEKENSYLQEVCAELEAQIKELQRVPLTDEQIKGFLDGAVRLPHGWRNFARAIEAAHNIKPTP